VLRQMLNEFFSENYHFPTCSKIDRKKPNSANT